MKLAGILSSIFLYLLFSSTRTIVTSTSTGSGLALDLSNVDSSVSVDEGEDDGTKYKAYIPKANQFFSKVSDTGTEVWEGPAGTKCTVVNVYWKGNHMFLNLTVRTNQKNDELYFSKVDGTWQSTTGDEMNKKLEGASEDDPQENDGCSKEGGTEQDEQGQQSIDNDGFNGIREETEKEDEDDSVKQGTADDIMVGPDSVPDTPKGKVTEQNTHVILQNEIVSPEEHDGQPHDVVLEYIGSPTELPTETLLQSPTTPVRLTPQEMVSIPGTPIHAPLNDKGVALDISSPDSSKVSVTSRTSGDMDSKVFYPEGHVSIVCIMDSGMPILAEAGTICTEAYLFSKPGFPPLLKVHTNGGGSNACTYFEKVDGGWTRVNKDEFDGKLGTMKNGMIRNVDVQNAFPAMEQHGNSIPTVQNVESVPNTHIGTQLQARVDTPIVNNHQGSHSGSYPVGPPMVTSPPKDFVDEPVAQHPTVPPTAQENVQALIPATPTPPMAEESVHAHVPQMAPTPSTGVSPPMTTQHLAGNTLRTPGYAHPGDVNPPTQAMPMQVHPQVAMAPPQANPPATPIPQMQTMSPVPTQGHPMNTPTQHPTGTALRQDWVHPTGGAGGMPEHMPPMEIPQMMQRPVQTIPPGHVNHQTVPTHMDVLRVQGVQVTQHSVGNILGAQEPAMQANPMQITNQVTASPPQAFPQKPFGQPVGQQPAMQAIPQVATTPPHAQLNPLTQAMPMQVTPQMIVIPVQANPQLQAVQMVNQHSATFVRGQEPMYHMEIQCPTGNVSRTPEHAQVPPQMQPIPPVQGVPTVQHQAGNVTMTSGPVQGAPMDTHLRAPGPVQVTPQLQTVTHTGVIQGRQEPMPTMQTVTLVATANPTQGIPPRQAVPQAVQTQGHPMNIPMATQHPAGNVLMMPEPTLQMQVNPQVMKPPVQANPQLIVDPHQGALLRGQVSGIQMNFQNDPYAQPIPQVQVTSQVGNILVLPQQVPLMDAVPPMPTPPMDIPSSVEPKMTYAPSRNVETGYNKPREIMNKHKDATLVKTVDLAEGDSPSTTFYKLVEDGIVNKSYFPKNHTFDNVMDGDVPIWTAGAGEECTMAWMCSREGHSSLLTISVKNANEKIPKPMYLEKNDDGWTRIAEANFKAKRELMKVNNGLVVPQKPLVQPPARPEKPPSPVAVDTTNLHRSAMPLTVSTPNSFANKACYLRENIPQRPPKPHELTVTEDVPAAKDAETAQVAQEASENEQETGNKPIEKASEPTVPITMDLANIENHITNIASKEINGISYEYYSPKGNFYYDKFVDNKITLWLANENEKCVSFCYHIRADSKLLTLEVKHKDSTLFRHFEKWTGGWRSIYKPQFELLLEEMKNDASIYYILDLASVDTSKVLMDKVMKDDVFHVTYYPVGCTDIISIVEGSSVIWNAREDERLRFCYGYSKQSTFLLHLCIVQSDKEVHKYFSRLNEWSEMEEGKFMTAQISLHSQNGSINQGDGSNSPVVFDIMKPDELKCKTFKCTMGAVETLLSASLWGLKEIKCGANTIWTAENDDQKCILLKIHYKDSQPTVVHLAVESKSQICGLAYKNDKATWKKKNDYYKDLRGLVKGASTTSGFVLDLDKTDDTQHCKIFTANIFGMDTFIFVPKPEFNTLKVTCGNMVLHKSSQNKLDRAIIAYLHRYSSSLSLIFFVTADSSNTTEHYYVKEGDVVHNRPLGKYSEQLIKLRNRQVTCNFKTLDIMSPSTSYKFLESYVDYIPAKLIILTSKTFVNRIICGTGLVWEASQGGERCVLGTIYLKDKVPTILHVLKSTSSGLEDVYFMNELGKWSESKEYARVLPNLRTLGDCTEDFSLDITSFGFTPKCNVLVMDAHRPPMVSFVPKDHYNATYVLYGKEIVWKWEKQGQRATAVRLYLKDGEPFIIHILSRDESNSFKSHYYERSDGKWNNIKEDAFKNKISTC